MNAQTIFALVGKDLTLYFKNRFFAFITIMALVAYAVIYFVMPREVDETLEIAVFAPGFSQQFAEELGAEGLIIHEFESEQALKDGIAEGDFNVGVALPDGYAASLVAGQDVEIGIFFSSDFPEEFQDFYVIFFREVSYTLAGKPLKVDVTEEVLGHDFVGEQIPARDRMLPLFAVFILMMETMGLASLITSEIEGRTIQALLITPLTTAGLFVSKGIMGTGLAFVQAAALMLVTGGFSNEPLIITVALLLGGLLATGIGFLIASVAKDMMSVLGWGVLAIIVLAIPTFNVLLPGTISDWILTIPSFYLVDTVHQIINFDASWGEVSQNLLYLFLFSAAFFALGMAALRRKFR
jgi:ABC-2 type transport system permease protein